MIRHAFERLVRKALRSLPPEIAERLENVAIVVEGWPSPAQLEEGEGEDRYGLLGLYQGVPLTDRGEYGMTVPDKISIFQGPIEALNLSPEETSAEVRRTVIHEVAHHFGFSDEDLHALDYD
ncbi:MAG: metallopeptidase family protein [Chloroflexi bacterium]|nr:metallopeptidase family protein [Chloroflexota bacterium]